MTTKRLTYSKCICIGGQEVDMEFLDDFLEDGINDVILGRGTVHLGELQRKKKRYMEFKVDARISCIEVLPFCEA